MRLPARIEKMLPHLCSSAKVGRARFSRLVLLLLVSSPAVAVGEGVPEALRQAWQRRQDLVKTARFEWQSDCEQRPVRISNQGAKSSTAAELVAFRLPAVFMLDGNKCRYKTRQINLQGVADPTEGEYLSTYDGGQSRHLFSGKAKSINRGVIHAAPKYNDMGNIHFRALTVCFRGLDPRFHGGVELLSDFELVSSDEVVDGRQCILLRKRPQGSRSDLVDFLFVDPAREYVVVRHVFQVKGKLSTQLDITYAEDPTVGWVPSGWHIVRLNRNGDITERSTAVVSDHGLNERLSEKVFTIDFAPGTYVDDRASRTDYLLRSGGDKRPIMPVERRRGATWEQIMATEPGKAGLRQDWISRRTLVVAIGAFVALCVAVVLVRRWRSSATLMLLLLISLPVGGAAQGVPDALRQAWQRRQDLVKTARFEWQSRCEKRPVRGNSVSDPVSVSLPAVVFMLDGKRCRYSTRRINLANAANPTRGEYLSTFDERHSMELITGIERQPNVGIIHAGAEYNDVDNIEFRAVTLCFRPLDPSFHQGRQLSRFELVSIQETVDGTKCILLRSREAAASGSKLVRSLFVDPAREYVVVRRVSELNGKLSTQLDITYTEDRTVGWVPSGWQTLFMRDNGVIQSRCTATVTDYALNEPLSEKLFVIDFPPGTYIEDRAAGTDYLVRGGGEKRPIMAVERRRGATWEQLMASEPGKAGLRQDWISRQTLILSIGGFVALCFAVLLLRRWQSS